MEVWRSYKDIYEVSNLGNVRTIPYTDKSGHLRTPKDCAIYYKKNYYYTTIHRRPMLVSLLVAKVFPDICGEWFEGCDVHHKDFDRSNNSAENLIVLSKEEHIRLHHDAETTKENRSKARKKWWSGRPKNNVNKRKPIIAILEGKIVGVYDGAVTAAKELNISRGQICNNLKGRSKYTTNKLGDTYQFVYSDKINNVIKIEER